MGQSSWRRRGKLQSHVETQLIDLIIEERQEKESHKNMRLGAQWNIKNRHRNVRKKMRIHVA